MPENARQGRVIAAHGRHYGVQFGPGELRHCYTRGKKAGPAVGDQVRVLPEGRDEGVITEILPRRNLLYRSDASRSKQFAANLDQLLLIVAPEPEFSSDLMGRALVAAGSAGIPVRIALNKADLPTIAGARERLRAIAALGVPIVELCALDAEQVHARLGAWLAWDRAVLSVARLMVIEGSTVTPLRSSWVSFRLPLVWSATTEFGAPSPALAWSAAVLGV